MGSALSCESSSNPLGATTMKFVRLYAEAERDGQVRRIKNASGKTPEEYALALWRDGDIKGWLSLDKLIPGTKTPYLDASAAEA